MNTNYLAALNCYLKLTPLILTLIADATLGKIPAQALTFNFTAANDTPQEVIDGFVSAGNLWSSVFSDPVTVNVDISFQAQEPGLLGSTISTQRNFSYQAVRGTLFADITSIFDLVSFVSLQNSPTFNLLINHTADNPNGGGSSIAYLDDDNGANNSFIRTTTANAKALGLLAENNPARDALITFNSLIDWDFDRSDGIGSSQTDFIGVAAHELGHALGFISGLDLLDTVSSLGLDWLLGDNFYRATPVDLFRFSQDSVAAGAGVIDFTAGCFPPSICDQYFSINGGVTKIASVSTGESLGDGNQASHWQDFSDIGIMDPTADLGELLQISGIDRLLFDVIGWDLAALNPQWGITAQNQQLVNFSDTNITVFANSNTTLMKQSNSDSKSIPELTSPLSLLAIGALGTAARLKQKQQKS